MAVYVDHAYYTGQFFGTAIAASDFPRLAKQASTFIDQVTFGRAAGVVSEDTNTSTIEKIKDATCAVAEICQESEDGGQIAEERVGNHSVKYAIPTQSKEQRMYQTAKSYLGLTGLMYAGVD